jgi:hypothetical protein
MIQKTNLLYPPKLVSIFWYDSNYDEFSRQNAKFDKFAHFKEFIFTQQWLT